jgi:hypothetical protein
VFEPVDSSGMQSALPKTEQPSESLAHRPARCCVDERLSPGPALRSLVTLLRKLRYVPRSCQYRSNKIDVTSKFPYMLSHIFDTLSILIDAKTFCGSISPEKELLQHADYRRLFVWLSLSAPTRLGCAGDRETFPAAHAIPPGAVSHGVVQQYSAVSIQPG